MNFRRANILGTLEASTLAWIALSVVIGASGCEEVAEAPKEPGAIALAWRVSPLGCQQSGVAHVQIAVDGIDAPVSEQIIQECGLSRATIEELPPGRYVLTLLGLDLNGRATFTSEAVTVGVSPETTATLDELRLTARGSSMDVGWYFENSRLCASNNVDRVVIGVYDDDAFAISEATFRCDQGVGAVVDLQSGVFVIEVVGLSATGEGIFRGLGEIALGRGEHKTVEVALSECRGGC